MAEEEVQALAVEDDRVIWIGQWVHVDASVYASFSKNFTLFLREGRSGS